MATKSSKEPVLSTIERLKSIADYNGADSLAVAEFYESVKDDPDAFVLTHEHFAKIRFTQTEQAMNAFFKRTNLK